MRLNVVLRYVGLILLLDAAFMLLSVVVSLLGGMDTGFYPLLQSFVLTAILGAFPLIFVPRGGQITSKEGYAIVVGAWLMSCLAGMLPYVLWGGEFLVSDAWFEAVSGFTTKMRLSSVELSSMAKDNFRYRTQKILQILLVVYVGLTLVETVLLRMAGMSWFEAVCNSFSTIATGGFCTRNASIAAYGSLWVEMIVVFFMAVSGLHFGLIFATLTGKSNNIFRSEISRYYVLSLLFGGLIVSVSLWASDMYPTFASSMRYGFFQVVSVSSTTGFATADSSVWTPLAIMVLTLFTMQCACAGSTAGGIKCDRVLLAFKTIRAMMIRRQHPNAVIRVKLNGVIQEQSVVDMAMLFIVFYLMLLALGTIVVAAFGMDLETSFSMTASCMANAGVGFGKAGSMSNYHDFPGAIKYICTVFMLLGRLEIFGLLQLFVTNWWK